MNIKKEGEQDIQLACLPVKLVYSEEYERVADAFYREKQVQGWRRAKKEALINGMPKYLLALAKKIFNKSTINKDSSKIKDTPVVE